MAGIEILHFKLRCISFGGIDLANSDFEGPGMDSATHNVTINHQEAFHCLDASNKFHSINFLGVVSQVKYSKIAIVHFFLKCKSLLSPMTGISAEFFPGISSMPGLAL